MSSRCRSGPQQYSILVGAANGLQRAGSAMEKNDRTHAARGVENSAARSCQEVGHVESGVLGPRVRFECSRDIRGTSVRQLT